MLDSGSSLKPTSASIRSREFVLFSHHRQIVVNKI